MDDSKRLEMEGKWDQARGRVKEAWGVLTDDDLDRTEGKWDRLVGVIKERTGESAGDREEAPRTLRQDLTFEPNERELSHGGCPRLWRGEAAQRERKLVPPWLKIVVVLEELGETHTAGSEDHRVDAAALRAVGHGHGGAHHRKTTGSS